MRIYYKWLQIESILMQMYIYGDTWIKIEVIENFLHLIFKIKALKNFNIANCSTQHGTFFLKIQNVFDIKL